MNPTKVEMINDLIWRETDDGIVVVDPNEGKVRVLNGVASDIWKIASNTSSIASITDRIVSEYQVEQNRAEGDVNSFLQQMAEFGLMKLE